MRTRSSAIRAKHSLQGLLAAGKLQDGAWIPQRPVTYPLQNVVNISLLLGAVEAVDNPVKDGSTSESNLNQLLTPPAERRRHRRVT